MRVAENKKVKSGR